LCALEGDDEEDEDVMDGANSLHRRGVLPRLTRGTWTVRTKKRKRKRRFVYATPVEVVKVVEAVEGEVEPPLDAEEILT